MANTPDTIERSVLIKAPRERVWRALADAEEFGTWFRARFEPPHFEPGAHVRARVLFPGYEHVVFDLWIEALDAPERMVYRWHPYAIQAGVDYSAEEPTRVSFTLAEAAGQGTLLTVVESGFSKLPPERRDLAFRMNSGGWEAQLGNITRHLDGQPAAAQ